MKPKAGPARLAALALVLAALGYTAFLCLVHTRFFPVGNDLVAAADGMIVVAALALALWRGSPALWMLTLAVAVNFLALALLADDFNPKAVRDVMILVGFAVIGRRFADAPAAQTAFIAAAVIVTAVALFEVLAPTVYTSLFDVFDFYARRGVITSEQIQYQSSSFFVSGERGEGRFIAPWLDALGVHRASSLFLEPVSLGNFGALAAAFAIALPRRHWRLATAIGAAAAFAIVTADARFAAAAVGLFLVARLAPLVWTNVMLAVMPLVAIGALLAAGATVSPEGDDFLSRLSHSGNVLAGLDAAVLFGLRPFSITAVDSGYAYALANFGLPLCILLWASFVALPAPNAAALRYKLLLGVYACALLCISGSSLFALKTAALGWFALGALAAGGLREPSIAGASAARALPA